MFLSVVQTRPKKECEYSFQAILPLSQASEREKEEERKRVEEEEETKITSFPYSIFSWIETKLRKILERIEEKGIPAWKQPQLI